MKKEKVYMNGFKGFDKDLKCRGKQYMENSVAEEDDAIICNKGIHFCKDPADVLDYYPMLDNDCNFNEFRKIQALDKCSTDDGKKFVTKKIKLAGKLSFMDLINLSVNFNCENIIDKCNSENNNNDSAQIGSSGYSAKIGSSGYSAKIGSSGDYAQIGSSGDYAQINSTGKYSVIMCAGHNSKAKGKIGSWITLSEWAIENRYWKPICVKTEYIDGEHIKEDTWYYLKNGEFIEYENNNQ